MGSEVFAPDPERIGSWIVSGRLGAGGMGVVYRARHDTTVMVAAVKTIAHPDPAIVGALRREIRALARLRHPGVVPILDDGVQGGVPWYAMALVEGPSLEGVRLGGERAPIEPTVTRTRLGTDGSDDVTRAGPDVAVPARAPEPHDLADLPRIARIYSRLAAVLAWIHGEGVVHQDLKPANVLLRPGDLPILVDFGLAGAFERADGRDALEVVAPGGTVAYLSPERIRGEVVDARADLYALGVMLFRALTGRTPFTGAAADVLDAHLRRAPPRPSEVSPGVPERLDGLVLGLLRKDPAERIGHADAVVEQLAEWTGADAIPGDWPRPRSYLYRPRVVGRAEAHRWLGEQIAHGRVALVVGATGLGKTRMLVEAGKEAAARGAHVLTGRAVPPTEPGSGPLHPLKGPLEQLAERHRDDPEGVFADRGHLLAPFAAVPVAGRAPPDLPPVAARERLLDAVAETFRAAARRGPVLLLLDDLHDADALTVDVLDRLARDGRPEPLVAIGTWRSDRRGGPLLERPEVARLKLEPLDAASLARLVTDMLAQARVAEPLLDFLGAHAEGNPLFVAEYLRAAFERGMLRRDRAGRWALADTARPDDIGLPTSIEGLLEQRLAALDAGLRAIAELASVLGREVDVALLERAFDEVPLDAIDALVDRQILASGAQGTRFVQPALRERLYRGIDPERRRGLHGSVAAALPADDPRALGARAWHFEQSGDEARAAALYLEAGGYAAGRYDFAAAESALRSAIRLGSPETRLTARYQLGYHVLHTQGRLDEATAETEIELAEARAHGLDPMETRAMRSLGSYELARGRYAEARGRFAEALALDRSRGNTRGVAFDAFNLGQALRGLGRPAAALEVFEEATAAARETNLELVLRTLAGNVAGAWQESGDYERAEALYVEALRSEVSDRRIQATVVMNLANLLLATGRVEEARARYDAALATHREIGYRLGEAEVLENLAFLLHATGAVEAAVEPARQAIDAFGSLGSHVSLARAQIQLADTLHALGRTDEAAALLAEVSEPIAMPVVAARLAVARARISRRAGRTEEAARCVAQARAVLEGAEPLDALRWRLEAAFHDPSQIDAIERAWARLSEPHRRIVADRFAELPTNVKQHLTRAHTVNL